MKNLLYLIIPSFVLFVHCKEKRTENIISFTEKHDTVTQQKAVIEVVEKEYIYDDIYYLPEDNTIFMEYHWGYFRLYLNQDTTTFFDTYQIEDKADSFDTFYNEKDIGGLYTDYHYNGEHRLDKPNMIYVFFKNNRKTVPYGLADKKFTFLLK